MRKILQLSLVGIITLILSVFSGAEYTFAQTFQLLDADDILVETVPRIPGPNEEVTVTLDSYSFNLNNYYIAWFENGVQRSADFGNREYSFTTGNSGEVVNITAVVEVGDQVFRKELRFSPSEVDLLWEVTDAYTPPFYKGKALPLRQSTIRITAIPETRLIAPSDAPKLIYYWENNYQRDVSASGFGRQSYTIEANELNFIERISVTANDRRENSFAQNTIEIPTNVHEPKILFYEIDENNRLLTNRALNNQPLISQPEIRMSFHPLHMSTVEENFVDLFVEWNINNEPQPPQSFERQSELYISSGGSAGNVPISVTLSGIDRVLQEHTENINLIFNRS